MAILLLLLCNESVGVAGEGSEVNPELIVFPKPDQYSGEWYDLCWSPSGDKVAFVADGDLLVMNADGTEIQEIAHQPSAQTEWRSPSWSPDGSKIVGAGWIYTYVMNADGSNKTKVTEEDARMPALSSDGSKIAFNKGWLGGLWVIDINGSNPHMIVSSTDPLFNGYELQFEYIDWSSDDSKMVFCATEFPPDRSYSNSSIWVMNSDGSGATRLFHGGGGGLAYKSVQWSPNEDRIIYSLGVEESSGIWTMNADGSNKTLLVEYGSHATWSPDGTEIVYYGGIGIYVLDLQSPYVLPPDSDGDQMPDLWEYGNGLNVFNATDAQEDSLDEDGLTNLEEYTYKTSLGNVDTDDDGLSDGLEVHVFRTDPTKKDTDGNGISDGLEAAAAGFNAHVMILPRNHIKVQLLWSNNTMEVLTNSSVIGISFNSTGKKLTVNVEGTDGTLGVCNLTIPKSLVSSTTDIRVYLDDQPLNLSVTENHMHYFISVRYTHSKRVLLASFTELGGEAHSDYTPYIIGGALLVGLGIIALLVLRRKKSSAGLPA